MSRNFDGGENLEENKDCRVYRYGDDLKPGYELKVEHSVSCENVDISALIAMGTESLEAMRQGSIDGEQKAYEIVLAAAKQWEQQAAATQTIQPGAGISSDPGDCSYIESVAIKR